MKNNLKKDLTDPHKNANRARKIVNDRIDAINKKNDSKIKKIPKFIRPQRGLQDTGIRIGNWGVRTTPRERPISPLDCERYPDSPFCGGNPFTPKPIGYGPDGIVIDACTLGIQFSGSFGFVKTPKWQIVIKREGEDCDPPPMPEPPPKPGRGRGGVKCPYLEEDEYYLLFCSVEEERSFTANSRWEATTFDDFYGYREIPGGYQYEQGEGLKSWKITAELASTAEGKCRALTTEKRIETSSVKSEGSREQDNYNRSEDVPYPVANGYLQSNNQTSYRYEGNIAERYRLEIPYELEVWQIQALVEIENNASDYGWMESPFIFHCYYGRGADLKEWLDKFGGDWEGQVNNSFPGYNNPPSAVGGASSYEFKSYFARRVKVELALKAITGLRYGAITVDLVPWRINTGLSFECLPWVPPPDPNIDPQNRPRQRNKKPITVYEDDMTCNCDELARQIKLLRREVGLGNINLPDSLLTLGGKSQGKSKVSSVSELMCRQIMYFDELFGKWEVEIEIQDAEPLKEGDQKKTLKLPNLASAVGTLMQIAIDSHQASSVSKNAAVRALVEIAQTKQLASKNYWAIETIIEYLGFKTEEKTEAVNFLCNLFQQQEDGTITTVGKASEFLQESSMPVSRLAYKPGKKEENFQDALFDLAQAAAIIRAAFYVRADEENPAETVKSRVKNHGNNLDRLIDTEKSTEDFQQELEYTENAWGHLPQRTDPEHPWGGDYGSRPKIKDITPGNQQGADTDGGKGGIK